MAIALNVGSGAARLDPTYGFVIDLPDLGGKKRLEKLGHKSYVGSRAAGPDPTIGLDAPKSAPRWMSDPPLRGLIRSTA